MIKSQKYQFFFLSAKERMSSSLFSKRAFSNIREGMTLKTFLRTSLHSHSPIKLKYNNKLKFAVDLIEGFHWNSFYEAGRALHNF